MKSKFSCIAIVLLSVFMLCSCKFYNEDDIREKLTEYGFGNYEIVNEFEFPTGEVYEVAGELEEAKAKVWVVSADGYTFHFVRRLYTDLFIYYTFEDDVASVVSAGLYDKDVFMRFKSGYEVDDRAVYVSESRSLWEFRRACLAALRVEQKMKDLGYSLEFQWNDRAYEIRGGEPREVI